MNHSYDTGNLSLTAGPHQNPRLIRLSVALLVVATFGLTGCGNKDSKSSDSTKSETTVPAAKGPDEPQTGTKDPDAKSSDLDFDAPANDDGEALVDIVECEASGGTVTASGTILNQSDSAKKFTFTIGVYTAGTSDALGSGTAATDEVNPGEEAPWKVTVGDINESDIECHTLGFSTD